MTRTDLATGTFDCWPVEIQGLVHSVHAASRFVTLHIATNEGPIDALLLRQDGVDYQRFFDAAVVVHGVVAPDFNRHRQMTGLHLFVQSADDVSMLVRGGGDPFVSEVRPIGHLANFDPDVSGLNRVHLRGRVTLDWAGHLLCLQDGSGGLCVQSSSPEKIAIGTTVDVAGYPQLAAAIPGVEDAVVRPSRVPLAVRLIPRPVEFKAVLNGEGAGQLVTLDGQLVGVGSDSRKWVLTLISQGVVYSAAMPKEGDLNAEPPWREGSYVRVTGVCEQEVDELAESGRDWTSDRRFKSFRVLLRTTADVTVLRAPSWWTPGHAVPLVAGTLFMAMAGFGWVILLRRRVDQKTHELRVSEERFRNLAHHDALTGAPNRALFQDRAGIALERARRQRNRVGLLLIDLDHFKPINDRFGHEAGDRVLCAVVERAGAAVRKSDTVARLGGDEFAVLISDQNTGEEAQIVAEKVLQAVCQPLLWNGYEIAVSGSIGIAMFPEDGDTLEELLRNADTAMYASKERARGSAARCARPQAGGTPAERDVPEEYSTR